MKRTRLDVGTLLRCGHKYLVAKHRPANRPAVYSIGVPADKWVQPMMRPLRQQQPPNSLYGPWVAVRPVAMQCTIERVHVCDGYCDGLAVPMMHVSQRQSVDNRIAAIVRLAPVSVRAFDCWTMTKMMWTEGIRFVPSPINVSSAIGLRAVRT